MSSIIVLTRFFITGYAVLGSGVKRIRFSQENMDVGSLERLPLDNNGNQFREFALIDRVQPTIGQLMIVMSKRRLTRS